MLDSNLPATLRRLSDIVEEYNEKSAAISQTIDAFNQACLETERNTCIGGTYAGSIWGSGGKSYLHERTLQSNLLQSAWQHVYAGLNLDRIAPASDRSKFQTALKDPAPFTLDNIRTTFGKYVSDPRAHILRGLAECFSNLDPFFKSHDKMKIGVKGLPKRIILTSVGDYSGWGTERLRDTLNALRVLDGKQHLDWNEFRDLLNSAKKAPTEFEGMTLKRFSNGNGHLFFGPEVLVKVNLALAEYYGAVLPDCPESTVKKAKSTEVAKDLQFYRTPESVADTLVDRVFPRDGARILEPSCGDGAILDAIRRYAVKNNVNLRTVGIEVDRERASVAASKGFGVQCANFLQVTPVPEFDYVLMNPPFYGKHYQQHVEHAMKFLKPGGLLYSILPITALTDHGYVDASAYDAWYDLPVGSFSESGTNINTGIAMFKN